MDQIKIEYFEKKDDERVGEYESYYNAFIACYWIMMIVTIHFLFRFLNAIDNAENNNDMRFIPHGEVNMIRQVRPGNNFHRRFVENLNDEDLGYGEEDEYYDSRSI